MTPKLNSKWEISSFKFSSLPLEGAINATASILKTEEAFTRDEDDFQGTFETWLVAQRTQGIDSLT